jgi:hypothetical protein
MGPTCYGGRLLFLGCTMAKEADLTWFRMITENSGAKCERESS